MHAEVYVHIDAASGSRSDSQWHGLRMCNEAERGPATSNSNGAEYVILVPSVETGLFFFLPLFFFFLLLKTQPNVRRAVAMVIPIRFGAVTTKEQPTGAEKGQESVRGRLPNLHLITVVPW